ncbi:hypothetical protein RB195_001104 [Necator americanus]|uniref:Uncharacterized protein n=2 Tax=Necator americanus TaxID=51031 RepID=W2TN76_NECAM|nr:hypothetical protein NECAME_07516 [Necator americanus]ETN83218.1 hypothetical protein NECAME_07516 [Necator americanus]
MDSTFVRPIVIDENVTLDIHQELETDVGGVVWDSALVAAHYFIKHKTKYSGKKVLELGSGTGICGLTLAALAADVIITDLPPRLPLLEKNFEANRSNCIGSVTIQALDWSDPGAVPDVDVLVLVDCVYYLNSIDHLIKVLTCCNASEILCIYEKRDVGEPVIAEKVFLEKIVQFYDILNVPDCDLHPDYSCCDEISVIKLFKKYF